MAAEVKLVLKCESEEAAAKVRAFAATLHGVGEESQDASSWLSKLANIDVSGAASGWIKSIGATNISFADMHRVLMDGIRLFEGFARAAGEALKHAAESGDKSSQALLGGFEQVKNIVDRVVAAFVKDFAPSIIPLIQLFADLAKQVAEWSAKTGAGSTVAEGLVKVLLVLGTAFSELVNVMLSGIKTVYDQYLQVGIALNQFTDQELVQMKKTMDGLGSFQKSWQDTTTTVLDQLALVASGQKKATETQINALAELGTAHKKSAEDRAKDAEEAAKRESDARVEAAALIAQAEADGDAVVKQQLEDALATRQAIADEEKNIVDDRIADIERTSQSEEELKSRTIEYLRDVAANEQLSASVRAAAQAKLATSARTSNAQMATDAKKSADDQAKAAADAQKKVVASYQQMFGLLKLAVTDWKGALSQALDLLTKSFIDNLTKQAAATTSTTGTIIGAQASQTSAFAGAQASASGAAIATIAPKVTSWAASLGPFGLAIVPGLIAAFMAFARSKVGFEEGYSPGMNGQPPGLGRTDSIDARIASTETVLSENQTGKLTAILDRLSSGQGAGVGGSAAPVRLQVEVSIKNTSRGLARAILEALNVEVRQYNGDLEATRLYG